MAKNNHITKVQYDSLRLLPLETNFRRLDHREGLAPYFREYLRLVMTANKPDRRNYPSWSQQQFYEDSLAWETNPLFGWCNKNKKPDGSNYNVYTDGLKIYTTLDSRMQAYAEEAVREQMTPLQASFFRAKAGRRTAPYTSSLTQEQVNANIDRSIRQSDRYRGLQRENKTEAEIREIFNIPVEMSVFTWQGVKDTIMSPYDSIVYKKFYLRTGFVAMDPRNGSVKAYVGGIDYNFFQYDMVNTGKRQIGSTVKPFLYALAMESGITPCDEMLHVEQTLTDELGRLWTPNTSGTQHVGEMVSIRWGLQQSSNWVSAYLMKQLNPYTFARLLRSFGLKNPAEPVVSLCLGPNDASVGEIVSGYSVFANRGLRNEPLYVVRIENSFGDVLETFTPQISEIISEDACYKMLNMLQGVIDGGTGGRIRRNHGMSVSMGGKTGTSQNHSDGWFVGFTPTLVAGAWVGGEDRDIHFDRMTEGQGAAMALPIVGIFLNKVYNNPALGYSQTERFDIPEKYANPCISQLDMDDYSNNAGGGVIDDLFR
jgi:penicillin-binding protein 1A